MKMKPTPGPCEFSQVSRIVREIVEPYREICDLTESDFPVNDEDQNGEFIAEAFNVHHETGLSPRELLAERDQLIEALEQIANDGDGAQMRAESARAAIAATRPQMEGGK